MGIGRGLFCAACLCLAGGLLSGCHAPGCIHDPEYAALANATARAACSADATLEALPPVAGELGGPHAVEEYVAVALAQNPNIQAARMRVEALAHRVPQAASLEDPTLGVGVFAEPIQTAAGQQDLTMQASQRVPWIGKLRTRAAMAQAEADVARAELAAAEWRIIEQVKRAYYEMVYLQQAIRIVEEDRQLLEGYAKVLLEGLRTGRGKQRDVLRAQVEVASRENELIRFRQQLGSTQARLAGLLHVSPDTPVRAFEELPPEELRLQLDQLYASAVNERPELHALLAAVERDQRAVVLAELKYYPDPTFALSWFDISRAGISPVANGRDAFLLGVNVNVPLDRKRVQHGIREAEAQAVSTARRYDALRDDTLEAVKALFLEAQSQYELIRLFRDDIVPKADLNFRQSMQAFEVGEIDFLLLVEEWRELLRFQLALRRVESQLRQTIAALERAVGAPVEPQPSSEVVPLPEATPTETTSLGPLEQKNLQSPGRGDR